MLVFGEDRGLGGGRSFMLIEFLLIFESFLNANNPLHH